MAQAWERGLRSQEARRAASAAALMLIVAGNGAVIVWMWLHDGGISDMARFAGASPRLGMQPEARHLGWCQGW